MGERERIRYRSGESGLSIGTFRAELSDPWFRNSGPIAGYLFVFPRTAVTITHQGERTVVADRNTVMFYNRWQHYTRGALSPAGDLCDWFAVPGEAALDAVSAYDPSVCDRPERPFPFVAGPCSAALYARQRQVVLSPSGPDVATDESILALLREVVAGAFRASGRLPLPLAPRAVRARRDLVEAARAFIAVHYRERLTLGRLAERLAVSPYHLSRVFKQTTGVGIHQYLSQLRLRGALARLEEPACSLTEVAIDLGFASHSHFTAAFRGAFGASPSALRTRLEKRQKPPSRSPR